MNTIRKPIHYTTYRILQNCTVKTYFKALIDDGLSMKFRAGDIITVPNKDWVFHNYRPCDWEYFVHFTDIFKEITYETYPFCVVRKIETHELFRIMTDHTAEELGWGGFELIDRFKTNEEGIKCFEDIVLHKNRLV